MNTLGTTYKQAYYKAAAVIGGSVGRLNFPLHALDAPIQKATKATAAVRLSRNRLSRPSSQHIPGGLTEGISMSPEISNTGTTRQG